MTTLQNTENQETHASRLERYHPARRQANQPILTLCGSILILTLLFGLGGLRLYCLSMEQKLTLLDQKIVQAGELRLQQERELASLLSPSRVYSYAHANLNMQSPAEILVVKVPSSSNQTARLAVVPADMKTAWYGRILNLFVRQASAHD